MTLENRLAQVLKLLNNTCVRELETKGGYLPLVLAPDTATSVTTRVGTVPPACVEQMKLYPHIFTVSNTNVAFNKEISTYDKISSALAEFLQDLRTKNIFKTLSGWRNECYEIRTKFSQTPFFKVERSATPLLGLPQYGVHINGYVAKSDTDKALWIQRRSKTKQTYPNKLDSFVGGGHSEGLGILETAVKELEEEAGLVLTDDMRLQPCGSVSFLHMSDRGLHPQTEFVFDLKLPESFKPANKDGEVDDFVLVTPKELLELVLTEDYKTTSVPIALDWLIRHGELTVQSHPDISHTLAEIHKPLHNLYL
eukprot:TRINITY_DN35706_c0_g1_i3.p1 TRINITY_DN35706_c0_g1~~TRINITY_DN35706_c0_g1_i3.p1  ORF type:complete len:310 (-),score=76.09 TRINITY_DN35706_c0_g1_i3:264-1193(-)